MKSLLSLSLLTAMLAQPTAPRAQVKTPTRPANPTLAIPMCKAADLSLGTDAENGSFNGMSHGGTLLVLRNLSSAPCRVAQRPEITFVNGSQPLGVKLDIPGARYMHPGPVLVPVVILPDAEVTAKLRWVSGEVYSSNVCLSPTAISVKIGDGVQQVPLAAQLCGDKAKGVTFEATPLAPDPAVNIPERAPQVMPSPQKRDAMK